MRIAICDDEKEQRVLLSEYCRRFDESLLVDTYNAAVDLLIVCDQISYDIIFMDIEMPSPNGFEVAEALRRKATPPLVIFVTKSNSYTILGYGIAFRYLPKPVAYEVFAAVLSLAIKEREPAKIPFVCNGVYYALPINKIIYCETLDHDLTVYTKSEHYTARMPMADLASHLPSEDFAQPHKSYLVNLKYVYSVAANNVILISGQNKIQLPLSKGKRKDFMQRLGDYIGR